MHGNELPDRDWDAEGDAHHLMRAIEVKSDPARLSKAKAEANRLADERFDEAKNLKKAAKSLGGNGRSSGATLPAELAKDGWTLG